MEETIKKILYTGVGAAALVIEAVTGAVEEISGKSDETEEKGQKIVEDMKDGADGKTKDFETKIKNSMDELFSDFRVAKGTEMDELKAQVEALTARVAELEKSAKPTRKRSTTTKKTPPKKKDQE